MIALWRGELPLSRAFWEYAILYGLIASVASTAAALVAFMAELPSVVAIVLYLLPAPYYALTVVGVWRSASAYEGPPVWAQSARIAVLAWTGLMLII